jgi:hypothetical protein
MSPGCAARWAAEGVEIRAIALPALDTVAGVTATDENRRNLTAHWFFGAEQLARQPIDPFTFDPAYSGFDRLNPADLTDVDVPLAVFRWNGQRVVDLDNWSARRRVTTPDPDPSPWSAVVADRREADGQARFLQFQDQLAQLAASGSSRTIAAATTFGLLPPAGFLPGYFDPWTFYEGVASFGDTLDWTAADFALRRSWQLPAAPTSPDPDEARRLTFYFVRESFNSHEPYTVFLTNLPWHGGDAIGATSTSAKGGADVGRDQGRP